MIVYAIVKYLVYSLWCYVGLRMLSGHITSLGPALGFGAVRWLLGLGFGILVFLAVGSVDRGADLTATRVLLLNVQPRGAAPCEQLSNRRHHRRRKRAGRRRRRTCR